MLLQLNCILHLLHSKVIGFIQKTATEQCYKRLKISIRKKVEKFNEVRTFSIYSYFLQRRERVEREVRRLRDEISVKKSAIVTATKGIPANKIEVRPQEQQPQYSGPTMSINPMLVGLSAEAQMILASTNFFRYVLITIMITR